MLSYMQNYDTIYQHMLVQLETFNYVKNNFNTNDYQDVICRGWFLPPNTIT